MLFTLIVSLLTMVYVIPLISPWSPISAQSLALIVTPFYAKYRGLLSLFGSGQQSLLSSLQATKINPRINNAFFI